jgi:hypothetical protein
MEKCSIVPMQLVGIIRTEEKMPIEPSKIQVKDITIMGSWRTSAVFIHGTYIIEIKQSQPTPEAHLLLDLGVRQ